MDKLGELNNRWFRIFEKETDEEQRQAQLKIPSNQITGDVRYLVDTVKNLEGRLSASQNKFSSQVGQTVLWKDGDLLYMLQGRYIPVEDLVAGLKLLLELAVKQKTTKEQNETIKKIRKGLGYDDKEQEAKVC